jgi:hypothetical protein
LVKRTFLFNYFLKRLNSLSSSSLHLHLFYIGGR